MPKFSEVKYSCLEGWRRNRDPERESHPQIGPKSLTLVHADLILCQTLAFGHLVNHGPWEDRAGQLPLALITEEFRQTFNFLSHLFPFSKHPHYPSGLQTHSGHWKIPWPNTAKLVDHWMSSRMGSSGQWASGWVTQRVYTEGGWGGVSMPVYTQTGRHGVPPCLRKPCVDTMKHSRDIS